MSVHQYAQYPIALAHPFDERAEGAQVPDMYTFPTQTSMLRTQFTIQSPPGATNIDFVVQPNLLATIASSFNVSSVINPGVSGQGPIVGGHPWDNQLTFATTITDDQVYWENGMISPVQLAAQYSRYRVVGYGVRVRSLIPPLNQQGTIAMCKVPSLSHFFNGQNVGGSLAGLPNPPDPLNPGAIQYVSGPLDTTRFGSTWRDYLNYYELPEPDSSNYITNTIISMPLAHQTSLANMSLDNGIEVAGKIASPDAFKWRDGSNDTGSFACSDFVSPSTFQYNMCSASQMIICTNLPATLPNQTVQTQIVGVNDEDFVQQGGWSVLCFRASGLLAGSSEWTPQFTVEIVFHIEGVPLCTATSFSNGAKAPLYSPHLLDFSLEYASKIPTFKKAHNKHHRSRIAELGDRIAHVFGFRSVRHALSQAGHQILQDGQHALAEFAMTGGML